MPRVLAVDRQLRPRLANIAEVWSQNMLMLREARQNLHAGSGPRTGKVSALSRQDLHTFWMPCHCESL